MSGLVDELMAALQAGQVEKFADLSPEQIAALTAEFARRPFTPEDDALFAGLVLVTTGRESEVAAFNAGSPVHKLAPAMLTDGAAVLPVSLLTWAGPGQGYAGAWDLLLSLPVRQVTATDWPRVEND